MAFEKVGKAMRDKDLMDSLGITLLIVVLYRLGSHIPVPGVPYESLMELSANASNGALAGIMSVLNMFSGGALRSISLFSLSIMPYITAQIIMQFMCFVVPSLHALQKQGEAGSSKLNQYSRYLTAILSIPNAIGYLFMFQSYGVSFANVGVPSWMMSFMFVASLVGGSMLLMYMGEKITDTKVFNGPSILILVNVVSAVPMAFYNEVTATVDGWKITAIIVAVIIVLIPLFVKLELGQFRIPVTYARQQAVGTKFAEQTTYLPIKANAQGVIPIMFASAFTYVPMQIAAFFPDNQILSSISNALSSGPVNWIVTVVAIIICSFLYAQVSMRPDDLAENLNNRGGFITDPKLMPGDETEQYISAVMYRVIVPAALVLAIVAIVPNILLENTGNTLLQAFGGTSILIMVGTLCTIVAAIDSQITMTSYDDKRFKRSKRKAVFGAED